ELRLSLHPSCSLFFAAPAPSELHTLSLHDALPILVARDGALRLGAVALEIADAAACDFAVGHELQVRRVALQPRHAKSHAAASRSEEHTSELQSPCNLVCRLLLEKKKKKHTSNKAH